MESKSCITGFCKLVVNCKMHNYRVFGTANFTTLLSVVFLFCSWKLTTNLQLESGLSWAVAKLEKA